MHALLTLLIDIIYLVYVRPISDNPRTNQQNAALALSIYTGMITLCVGGLCCYHTKLAVAGETTNEDIRRKYVRGGNPFNHGYSKNMNAFCFGGQSRITAEEYKPEDLFK